MRRKVEFTTVSESAQNLAGSVASPHAIEDELINAEDKRPLAGQDKSKERSSPKNITAKKCDIK